MKNYRRSDLACEAADDLSNIDGTKYSKKIIGSYCIESFEVISSAAAEGLGKKKGRYITITTPELWKIDCSEQAELSDIIGKEILNIILLNTGKAKIDRTFSVLIVGLGNTLITADAIGPQTVDKIEVTRHIKKLDPSLFDILNCCEISAISPGVLGKTGIESADIIQSACSKVRPDVVIIIDALAAGSIERLACTVQISDAGINPGAGIGNFRSELSRDTLGVPVIALGVPTVVDTSAVVYDIICRTRSEKDIPDALLEHLEKSEKYYVTPKESDLITENISILLSHSIEKAIVINHSS